MDKQGAKRIFDEQFGRYRAAGYTALLRLLRQQDNFDVEGSAGTTYQVEIYAMWDDREGGDLRVLGCIDDGG
jgi:hypothetical protein